MTMKNRWSAKRIHSTNIFINSHEQKCSSQKFMYGGLRHNFVSSHGLFLNVDRENETHAT